MKKALSTVLSLLFVLTLFPICSNAAESYGLYVNGSQFTSENNTIACGEGTAVYDSEEQTLTLTNATLDTLSEGTNTDSYESDMYGVINSKIDDLTIELVGTNVIDGKSANDGIDSACDCDVTITGDGSLELKNCYYGTYIGCWETEGGDLTVDDTTLKVTSPQCAGIWVNHDIDFIDSTVTVTKTTANYDAIVSNTDGTVTVDGGKVDVTNYHSAIHFGNGDETDHAFVLESGVVSLTSTDGYAITVEPVSGSDPKDYRGSVVINGGTLKVNSALGGVTLPDSAITLAAGVTYTKGNSLTESGEVEVGKSYETAYDNIVFTKSSEETLEVSADTDSAALIAEKKAAFDEEIEDIESEYDGITVSDYSALFTDNQYAEFIETESYITGATNTSSYLVLHYEIAVKYKAVTVTKKAAPPEKDPVQQKGAVPTASELKKAKTNTKLNIDATSIATISNIKKKTLKVNWKAVNGVSNYELRYRKAGDSKWTSSYTKGETTYTITKLAKGGTYEFQVRALAKIKGGWAVSAWSNSNYRYVYKATVKKATGAKKKFTVSWAKDKNASYYQVQYATDKAFTKGVKVVKVNKKKTSYTVKKLKKRTYYVRVRAVKTVKKKNYTGEWSAKKAVKVK